MFNGSLSWWRMKTEAVQRLPVPGCRICPSARTACKARLTITHGSQHCARFAQQWVPLVAIPITYEQPGIGHESSGRAEGSFNFRLSIPRLRAAIQQVLRRILTHHALRLKQSIRQSGGVMRAADIVEQAVKSGHPVAVGLGASTSW